MPYKPFVINETDGIEIRVLQNLEKALNVHFNISLSKISSSWGQKTVNNSWTSNLRLIHEKMYIGIGNVDIGSDIDFNDFSFSQFYHNEPLVFVIPIAQMVPEWRIITAIFTEQMWGVCFGVILIFAVSFFLLSMNLGYSTIYYNQPVLSSFQIFISHPVYKQPASGFLRVFFLSASIFSLIIAALYTSALVFYLKNPIRENQPDKNEDFVDKSGKVKYLLGGITKYQKIFNFSTIGGEIYQTVTGENDTFDYWLRKVAYERNIWTLSSSFYARYLVAKNSNITTDAKGITKIFVFKDKLINYSVGMIARKGHLMMRKFNNVLKDMLYGGLVIHYCSEYLRDIDKDTSADSAEDSTSKPLTIEHLQSTFFILFCGYVYGFVVLLLEIIIHKFQKMIRNFF